jgi:hypothetical protein
MSLAMEDFDSGKIWTFRYRYVLTKTNKLL